MADHSPLRREYVDSVAVLTLCRPEVRNAINDQLREELIESIQEVSGEDMVRAVVLTGEGSAFCSGGDVKSMQSRLAKSEQSNRAYNGWLRQKRTAGLIGALHRCPKVVVSAVNGPAFGLGLDVALAGDFIVASTEATFSSAFIKRGLIPDGGGLYFLPRRVGLQRAKRLVYSGETVEGRDALDMGLVDEIFDRDSLVSDAVRFAVMMSGGSPTALALMKSIIDQSFESSSDDIASLGSLSQAVCYTTAEHEDAVAGFLHKNRGDPAKG